MIIIKTIMASKSQRERARGKIFEHGERKTFMFRLGLGSNTVEYQAELTQLQKQQSFLGPMFQMSVSRSSYAGVYHCVTGARETVNGDQVSISRINNKPNN